MSIRVYELAKKLGLESKELLAQLKQMGEFARSASSTIEAPVVRKLIDRLQGTRKDSEAPAMHRRPSAASNEAKGTPRPGKNPISSTTVGGPLRAGRLRDGRNRRLGRSSQCPTNQMPTKPQSLGTSELVRDGLVLQNGRLHARDQVQSLQRRQTTHGPSTGSMQRRRSSGSRPEFMTHS